MSEQFVKASELSDCQRKLAAAEQRIRELSGERSKIETEARLKAERQLEARLIERFTRVTGECPGPWAGDSRGLAHVELPDNGGVVQVNVSDTGGPGTISLRVWGPPDGSENSSYGVHEQGGGNLTDFWMLFRLRPEGIEIDRLDISGRRL